jgi:transmembrane sensor
MTQNGRAINEAASLWAVRQKTRALSAQEQADLEEWLASDPRHRGALLRARAQWTDLDRLSVLTGHRVLVSGAVTRRRWQRHWLSAASVTVVAILATAVWYQHGSRVYVSDVGEVRTIQLADGSHMVLDADTRATVHFDKALREIELASGEGLFQVTKDPARPFVVRAGPVSVRAVGTVFAVRSLGGRVDVTVTEGVVELVDHRGGESHVIRRVSANEHASVTETQQVEVENLARGEAQRRLAWREGMLDFAGEPLSVAVDQLNRRNRRQIVIDDSQLGSLPVVGNFHANDPDGFAATIAVALGAQKIDGDDAIHLRRAAP